MRYAIVESGGKQYKAIEGQTIEVDRLSTEEGKQFELERILFMADEDEFMVGTPILSGIQVRATVVDHFRGDKVFRFKYSPKKRIRVRGGHRQQYTRLMVDFIGKPGEERKVEKSEPRPVVEKKAEPKAEKSKPETKSKGEKPVKESPKETPAKKAAKVPAKKPASTGKAGTKPSEKKSQGVKKPNK
jgi:large subunit ribosomal protein L21